MTFKTKFVVPAALLLASIGAQAQFTRLKGATVAVSATGEFDTPITDNASPVIAAVPTVGGGFINQTISAQANNATTKPGVLATFGFHPVAWAGVELNYQFAQYDETYFFAYGSTPAVGYQIRVPVAFHEATAAYQFHPKHIKFQPFVNIGGGAVDFLPYLANNQWRAAGLVETGFDIPTKNPHIAIRIQGRALIYRIPNFNNPGFSTRNWRVTSEPTAGLVYRF